MIGDIQKWWRSSNSALVISGSAIEKAARQIIKTLPRDASVLDIGGGEGRLLRVLVSSLPEGHHHVFEPIPDLFHKLKKQLPRTDIIHHHNLAAAHLQDHVSYVDFLRGFSEDPEPVRLMNGKAELMNVLIPCKPLDQVFSENNFSLIIYRQGGSLLKALEGGEALIKRSKPQILFGSPTSNYVVDRADELFEWLESLGYRVYPFGEGEAYSRGSFIQVWSTKKGIPFLAKA